MRRISLEPAAMVRSGGLFEGDLVAEGVELFDGSVALAVGARSSLEVVAAEVVVVGVFGEEMPADDEDGVADGDRGLFLADPSSETPELRCKVGVAGAGGRPGALHEDVAEPYVAVGGLAGTAFSAGDVVAGCHPRPGGQVGSGREPGHVDTDLGDDRLGGPFPDPGDGVEPVTGPFQRDTGLAGVRGEQRVDLVVETSGRGFEMGGVVQAERDGLGSGPATPDEARGSSCGASPWPAPRAPRDGVRRPRGHGASLGPTRPTRPTQRSPT